MPKLQYSIPLMPLPRFSQADGTAIDLLVVFPHVGDDPVLYTSAASDPGWEHSEEIYRRAASGEFGPVAPYSPPASAHLLTQLRTARDAKLAACDWTQMPDAPLTAGKKAEWAAYRQALRDLTKTTTNPASPVWPVEPA